MKDLNWPIWLTKCCKLLVLSLCLSSCSEQTINIEDAIRLTDIQANTLLNNEQTQILFEEGAVVISDPDSIEVIEYTFDQSEYSGEIVMHFLSGQRGFSHRSFKLFDHIDGFQILLVGTFSGSPALFEVNELNVYRISNNELKPFEIESLNQIRTLDIFISHLNDAEIKNKLNNSLSIGLDFDSENSNTIKCYSYSPLIGLSDYEKEFEFEWNGKEFILQDQDKTGRRQMP